MFDLKQFRVDRKMTQDDIASILKVTQGFISQVETGKDAMPDEWIDILNKKYSGEDLKEYFRVNNVLSSVKIDKHLKNIDKETIINLVRLLPLSAIGGSLNNFVLSVKDSDCEKIISPVKEADFAIRITGNSMHPDYPSGSMILIKKVEEKHFLELGRVYVLDTINGVVVKRITEANNNHFRCVSLNPDQEAFPPFNIPSDPDVVFGVYRVIMMMSMK